MRNQLELKEARCSPPTASGKEEKEKKNPAPHLSRLTGSCFGNFPKSERHRVVKRDFWGNTCLSWQPVGAISPLRLSVFSQCGTQKANQTQLNQTQIYQTQIYQTQLNQTKIYQTQINKERKKRPWLRCARRSSPRGGGLCACESRQSDGVLQLLLLPSRKPDRPGSVPAERN